MKSDASLSRKQGTARKIASLSTASGKSSERRGPEHRADSQTITAPPVLDVALRALQTSEIRYRRVFEAARDGILILNFATRKITDANPFMAELLGYSQEELLGKELWEIGLLKDETASRAAFGQLQRNSYIRYEDLPLQNKAGELHEVEFVSNVYDEDGQKVIQCNIRDITGRKRIAELERLVLQTSEIRYRRLFETALDGILILDPTTRKITDANPFMAELLGYSREALLGKELWEIGLLKDVPASRTAFQDLQRLNCVRYETLPLQNKAGKFYEVELISNVYDEDGQKVVQYNVRDISERTQMQETLRVAHEKLKNQAAELERLVADRTSQLRETIGELEGFSYSISHDMRAPLRAMQSYSQYLMDEYDGKLDKKGVNYLQQIMRAAIRLDRLTQDVLSYTRTLHVALPMERVDLDCLVRDIVETLAYGPIKPEIQIQGTLPEVIANEALLGQCVSNFLNNGAKFVAPGTTPHIEISAEAIDGAKIRVWFKDNGIGIAPENHDRIFRLFERIHPATEYEGTGIGLSIVRKAADRMGAQIGFESALGKGSNFWIQLQKG